MKKNKKTLNNQILQESGKEKLVIMQSAFEEILKTVGSRRAESGGILLGNREDYVVQKFVFDPHGSMSSAAYDPNIDFLNKVVKKEWKENGLALLGFLHSHPRGCSRLSGDYGNNTGDVGYMKGIFKAMPTLEKFLVPIMYSPVDGGELTVFPYMANRAEEENYFEGELTIIHESEYPKYAKVDTNEEYKFEVSRLKGSINIELMKKAKVVCVGVGGANGICESLIRSGLHNLVLIDFDEVDASNLATQGYFIDDIGKLKVEALRDRLLRINPNAQIEIHPSDFLEINDDTLEHITKNTDLLLMMTDNFHAQAYGNLVGLKYQIPTIFAMMYEKARGAEITFIIPGITPACHRCAVGSRYKAYYKEGYENDITSGGSTNFHTGYLNNSIGLLALAILHKETQGLEFSNWFGNYWDQNQIILRTSPFFQSPSFKKLTENDERMVCLDSVWHHIEPDAAPKYEVCPDCGGLGDLRDAYLHHQTIIKEDVQ